MTPAFVFQDHAVLQSKKPLPVWGEAAPGETVTVYFAGQSVSTVADSAGAWKLRLNPLSVNTVPASMTFKANNIVVINDVLVGEVWLCSGQSNMELKLNIAANAEAEIAASDFPLIRLLAVGRKASNTPVEMPNRKWAVSNPANSGSFTAVGYFFARNLHQKLGVPVGIIASAWGGTDLEAWMSEDSIASDPALSFVAANWQKKLDNYPEAKIKFDAFEAEQERKLNETKARGESYNKRWQPPLAMPDGSPHQNKPSNLFNGMIHPLLPTALAGILWYQAENNADRAAQYTPLFQAHIKGWRAAFAQGDLPFYWVQLPNFQGNSKVSDWVKLREAQTAALRLPATAQAITIDVGEVKDIHPKNKQDVGHRLALIALNKTYGQTIVSSGPVFSKAHFDKDAATISFNEVAGGLSSKTSTVSGFEIAGEDKKFKPAEASIHDNKIVVRSPEVAAPIAVRYAWRNAAEAGLYNSEKLPAAPFRTDDWAY